ncbi:phage late control D family protein [Siccirubricoccus sp. G192]|uniref:phage late control D family protein n=1 Tax=Siccirubricoccus sp. G192 TaxID=2849651 RepID=UPI001C2C7E19|nr:hypothetical protein [Siccirubricoccus sp. G192]MBV1800686.1 hypothetical protein [Siccirubricoccus sp. G192]
MALRLQELAERHGDFYVPAFAVRLGRADLVRQMAVAVSQAEADLSLSGMGRFSFTVVNAFDVAKQDFLTGDGTPLLEKLTFGASVEVAMGYGDVRALPVLVSGVVTEIGTNFAEGGSPELTVSGYDHSYPLSVGKNSQNWAKAKDSDVVAMISRAHNLDTDIVPTREEHAQIEQNQESDLEFVRKIAERNRRYKVYISGGRTLRFGPARDGSGPVATLAFGAGLLSFKPEANLAGQVGAVEIHGWDPKRGGAHCRACSAR